MVCDLLTHQPIDLLPDRTKDSVKEWLTKHSTVLLVTRDGSNTYRSGIDSVNRPIVQIMDRFHLIQILHRWMIAALQRILPRQWSIFLDSPSPSLQNDRLTNQAFQELGHEMNPKQQKKWELIQFIKKQHQAGQSIRFLAKTYQLSRNTVKKYVELKEMPINKRKGRTSLLDGYMNTITEAIENNVPSHYIFEQITKQGFKGSFSLVRTAFTKMRKQKKQSTQKVDKQHATIHQKMAISLYWKLEV